ncbi:MAG: hypothetical protein C0506_03410 [Anaerolinea sp.]|nr:hypothetical protein [Anaerolinea sp.]
MKRLVMKVRTVLAVVAGSLLVLVAACGGRGDDDGTPTPAVTAALPGPSPTVPPTPTAAMSLEDEILAAYLGYWDLYTEAVLNLDESPVAKVASDEEVQRVREEIRELRRQGVALRVVIEHSPVVLEASATSAVVFDEMTNNSFYVDPETRKPPSAPGSGETLKDTFFLEKVDGQWVVIRSVRQN